MTPSHIPVITIDGPTASGKGTVAHRVADKLGFHYLDSGALYRLTALQALRKNTDANDDHALAKLASNLPCHFSGGEVFLAKENVTQAIRGEQVGNLASKIAVLVSVRQALYALQLSFRRAPGLVADGRDMGTVIFPHAQLKVYLTASAKARAERRYKQLIEKGIAANIGDLFADLTARDERDTHRAVAPLKPAEGAFILDTSEIDADQAIAKVLQWYAAIKQKV
jgi:CMP/dCMP kinase